ncbi:MAG: hypothetical protein IKU70_06575 [Clostridia bacterium]|nr:hypothetical protein [Clostridia bacterium]
MTDLIRVDCGQMEALASEMRKLGDALDTLKSRINGVRVEKESGANVYCALSAVKLKTIEQTLRSGTTEECLRGLSANLGSLNFYADTLADKIRTAAESFRENEQKLVNLFNGLMTPEELLLGVGQALGYGGNPAGWTPEMIQNVQNLIQTAQILTDAGMTFLLTGDQAILMDQHGVIGTFESTIGLSGITTTSTVFDGSHRHELKTQLGLMDGGFSYKDSILKPADLWRKTFDENGNPVEGKQESGLGIGIFSVGASAEASHSWFGENAAGQTGNLSYEAKVGVGNAGANASIEGGLGAYVTENGVEITAGVQGEMGVSVSAANVEASMSYELIDNVSVGVGAEVSVLEGEAGVEAGIGLVDGQLMAYGEASAEINVIEAAAEGNIDLGLVEGKVGGSVSFGLGAHAKGGYNDGVLSFDVGVAAGLGVSVNAEINIGGAIDAIGDGIGEAVDFVGDGLSSLKKAIFG